MTKRALSIALIFGILGGAPAGLLHAASGTEGAAFLNIPVGAGPASLGSAYSALASDAYAPVWNPAGLGFLETTEVAAQHLSYLESIHYEFASFAHPFWKSTACSSEDQCGGSGLGAAMQYLGSGDVTGRDTSGGLTGNFSNHYAAATLGYGRALTDKIAVGIAGKGIQGKLADVSASAFAADFGLMARPTDRWTLAAVATNVGSKLTFLDQADPLPLAAHIAAAYEGRSWMLSTEGVFRRSGLNSAHAGFEWRPVSMIALRAGYRTDTLKELSPLAGFSTGVGLNLWGQELAYAWVPYGELGSTQYFSLLLRWGQLERSRRNLIHFNAIKEHRTVKENEPESLEFQQLIQLMSLGEQRVAEVPSYPLAPERTTPDATAFNPTPFVPHHSQLPVPMEEEKR